MSELMERLGSWLRGEHAQLLLRAAVALLACLAIYLFVRRYLRKKRATWPQAVVVQKIAGFIILSVAVLWVMNVLGLEIGVLLGAAGILSVALGFASQTAASNIISGLFLMAERPFAVGDVLKVGETVGRVVSIDLLSVKLNTFDNRLVRIPNETMIKTEFANITKHPIRRIDLDIGVAYKEDVERVKNIVMDIVERNPLCLKEPEPFFMFRAFGSSALELRFGVWTARENYLQAHNSLMLEIKRAFDEAGIEIPFPHVTLYTGSVTEPFPVKLSGEVAGSGDDDSVS